jgi:hypothetical protein
VEEEVRRVIERNEIVEDEVKPVIEIDETFEDDGGQVTRSQRTRRANRFNSATIVSEDGPVEERKSRR